MQKQKLIKLRINKKKLRVITPSKNYFLSLARAIIGQQISTTAASSIYKRFLELYKTHNVRTPNPRTFISFSEVELRAVGLSHSKVMYLRDLADKFLDKTINPKKFGEMSDAEIKEHLLRVKGIGPWTADMFLVFALNRPDILPVGDLGIMKGFQKAFNLKKLPTEKQMLKLAEAHAGARTELALHLWGIL